MKGDKRKRQLLMCAQVVFAARGFHDAQVGDISSMAKVAKGTIYEYFTNKEDLFCSLLELYHAEFKKQMAKSNIASPYFPSITDIENYINFRLGIIFDFICRDQDRGKILVRTGGGLCPPFYSIICDIEKEIFGFIVNDLDIAGKIGYLDKDVDIELLGNLLVGAIFRISHFYFLDKKYEYGRNDGFEVNTLVDKIRKMIRFRSLPYERNQVVYSDNKRDTIFNTGERGKNKKTPLPLYK
ncbi:MAG: TetR/AcrR family transcriptional regulator [bacterium]|nr:TetR/AcrR family transcriptional regulator [bacterium]